MMRLRILALALLLFIGIDADIVLVQQSPPPEPMLTIHDQPELALEDEPASFGKQILADLAAHRYLALDTLAAVLRDPEQRFRGGTSKITRFYDILSAIESKPGAEPCSEILDRPAFDARRTALEAWHQTVPDQPTAAMALVRLWSNAGWAGRGCAFAREVSDAQ
jgi:hypothetical protein